MSTEACLKSTMQFILADLWAKFVRKQAEVWLNIPENWQIQIAIVSAGDGLALMTW